jgi:hypothetical protein
VATFAGAKVCTLPLGHKMNFIVVALGSSFSSLTKVYVSNAFFLKLAFELELFCLSRRGGSRIWRSTFREHGSM